MAAKRKGADPVYAVEDAASGIFLKLDGEKPMLVEFCEATTFPATEAGRIAASIRLAGLQVGAAYEVVRIDA